MYPYTRDLIKLPLSAEMVQNTDTIAQSGRLPVKRNPLSCHSSRGLFTWDDKMWKMRGERGKEKRDDKCKNKVLVFECLLRQDGKLLGKKKTDARRGVRDPWWS